MIKISLKMNNEPSQIDSEQIPYPSYFTGEIDGFVGLFCKPHAQRIVFIDASEPISWVDDTVAVLSYKPVKSIEFKDVERQKPVLVQDIPTGTVFTGTHGDDTGRFLKLADGGLISLERPIKNASFGCWGDYCARNSVSNYKVVDVNITCEV